MTYLVVGLDRKTHAPWHENVSADDVGTAKRIATARAAAEGIEQWSHATEIFENLGDYD